MNTFIALENNRSIEKESANKISQGLLELAASYMLCKLYSFQLLLFSRVSNNEDLIVATPGLNEQMEAIKSWIQSFLSSIPIDRLLADFSWAIGKLSHKDMTTQTGDSFNHLLSDWHRIENSTNDFIRELNERIEQLEAMLLSLEEVIGEEKNKIEVPTAVVLEEFQEFGQQVQLLQEQMEHLSIATAIEVMVDDSRRAHSNLISGLKAIGSVRIPITILRKSSSFHSGASEVLEFDKVLEQLVPASFNFEPLSESMIFAEHYLLTLKRLLHQLAQVRQSAEKLKSESIAVSHSMMQVENGEMSWLKAYLLLGHIQSVSMNIVHEAVLDHQGNLDFFRAIRMSNVVSLKDL